MRSKRGDISQVKKLPGDSLAESRVVQARGRGWRGPRTLGPARRFHGRRPEGFTIIELIVVVAIVGVIIGLLIPTLSRIKGASLGTQCLARLAQLSIAACAYSNVYEGCYPAAILYESSPGGLTTIAWDFVQHPGNEVTPGPLWQFTDHPGEVMQDPTFSGASTFGDDPFTGFNYNTTYIGAEGRFPEWSADGRVLDGWSVVRRGLAPGRFRRASTTALFGQGGWRSGANKFMRAPLNTVEGDLALVYGGGQAFRVGGATAAAFLDGHVAQIGKPHEGQLATDALLSDVMDYPRNGFLSSDDGAYDPR